eukprot:10168199-Alexandrium_andersonii.AAC.1
MCIRDRARTTPGVPPSGRKGALRRGKRGCPGPTRSRRRSSRSSAARSRKASRRRRSPVAFATDSTRWWTASWAA